MNKRWVVLAFFLLGIAVVFLGGSILLDELGLRPVPPAVEPVPIPPALPPVAVVAPTAVPPTAFSGDSPPPAAQPPAAASSLPERGEGSMVTGEASLSPAAGPAMITATPPENSLAAEGTPVVVVPGPGTPTPTPIFAAQLPPDVINIVLLGSDRRGSSGPWRTDTIILVSIDRWNRTVGLLSIPRDLWVYMPEVGYGRINTADFFGDLHKVRGGGTALVKRTIEYNLGFPVHRYARIDFGGFVKIVDALGGLDIDVDCAINDPYTKTYFKAGVQHMNGTTALMYARSRYSTNDFDRSRRQQKVLQAIWKKVLERGLIPSLPILWGTLRDTVQTDLGIAEMLTLGYLGARLQPQQIRTQVLGWPIVRSWTSPEGAAVLLPNQPRFNQTLERFFNPAQAAGTAIDTGANAEPIKVAVLNGSGDDKLAGLAAASLERRGFQVEVAGPASRTNYRNSFILISDPDRREFATQLAQVMGIPATNIQMFPEPDSEFDLKLVVGKDYQPCGK